MGVGAGLYMYVVVVQKFTFAISSPDEFLYYVLKVKILVASEPTSGVLVQCRLQYAQPIAISL